MSHRTLHVPDLEAANHDRPGMLPIRSKVILSNLPVNFTLDIAPNQESKAIFDDSSVPLFTMYCKMTEEDNTKVEGWLKWVDKVVIFVNTSFLFIYHDALHTSQYYRWAYSLQSLRRYLR
jgi:hypothetical protein